MMEVNSTKGFLLTRQWVESNGQQDLIFWIASDRGPIKLVFTAQESVLFIREQDLRKTTRMIATMGKWRYAQVGLVSFKFEPMVACYFASQKELNIARSKLQGHVKTYEADLRPTDRYLMERFITAAIEVQSSAALEKSYRDVPIKPTQYMPNLSVVSLDLSLIHI